MAPFERALLTYCSDIVNLQALHGTDRSGGLRSELAKARQAKAELTGKLEKLTDAMLDMSNDGVPLVFAKRAREMEASLTKTDADIEQLERELASSARKTLDGADQVWQQITQGVLNQDHDARLRTRQLVADTFERIVVYHRGVRPAPPDDKRTHMAMMLVAKGGEARVLHLDVRGNLLDGDTLLHDAL